MDRVAPQNGSKFISLSRTYSRERDVVVHKLVTLLERPGF